jgi:hypothetical protein
MDVPLEGVAAFNDGLVFVEETGQVQMVVHAEFEQP